jgi:hypothetical protein
MKRTFIDNIRQKDELTEKGMVTNSTSLNNCVDLFFMVGASRHWNKSEKQKLFIKAFVEDPLVATKILFWSRDISGGAGERHFFRDIIELLNTSYKYILELNAHLIPYYGRWDDLFFVDKSISLPLIKKGLDENNNLLAKWLPRKKQYNNLSKYVRDYMGLSPKDYRKLISKLSDTVEQKMCKKEFNKIDYSKVLSVAMSKYIKSFYRNDEKRFKEYISDVVSGDTTINASSIHPNVIYRKVINNLNRLNETEINAIVEQWNSLPNYMVDSEHRVLPLIDVSPSMGWYGGLPMEVAVSLGVYISERNTGLFENAFITFSSKPTVEYLRGNLVERILQLNNSKWGRTTNIEAVFDLILKKSVENNLHQDEMPTMLLIISDMQFDKATDYDMTVMEMIESKYKEYGYKLPKIIYWNVRGESNNVPLSSEYKGVGLVSGFSPSILKSVLSGRLDEMMTPYKLMMKTIGSDRYSKISIE